MKKITFMTSLLTFYLKGEIVHEQNFIRLKWPNTLLTFIPLVSNKENLPVNQISSVSTSFSLSLKDLLIGLVVAIIVPLMFGNFLGIIPFAIGIGMCITAFHTILTIDMTSGTEYNIPFLLFEKSKAADAEEYINSMIANRMDDTNTRVHTERQTEALVDAINSLKN